MAKLPEETVNKAFSLQRRLWETIDEVTAVAWVILEEYGETEISLSALGEVDNSRERLNSSLSRLYTLMLRVAESQPMADSATLNLLAATIESSEGTIAAVEASLQEAKRNLNLP
ncbi:MAG: hypothetical protein F6J93_01315 [Oscillatoria sp. SIO1A7]|nr:hypothetical protein [Oscillatoria sp. SIO1A7]